MFERITKIERKIGGEQIIEDLNEVMQVTLEDDYTALIHIAKIEGSLKEKLAQFRDGLRKIAELLKNDERFSNVLSIGASSWIVTEHPKILEKFGFKVDYDNVSRAGKIAANKYKNTMKGEAEAREMIPEEHRDTEPMYAQISKDNFLELYGGN